VSLAGGELETFRGDVRHASVFGGDRFGFRVTAGYNRSDTYTRSRTLRNGTSIQDEYAPATDEPVAPTIEARPLNGQSTEPLTGAPLGERKPLQNVYGSARFDYYRMPAWHWRTTATTSSASGTAARHSIPSFRSSPVASSKNDPTSSTSRGSRTGTSSRIVAGSCTARPIATPGSTLPEP
jgi:hypothetical protein